MYIGRASRVDLPIPIMYRRSSDEHWFRATVVNMSESGVLFGPSDLEKGVEVELILSPPFPVGTFGNGKQVCTGQVVRTTGIGTVAARFEDCRFVLEF